MYLRFPQSVEIDEIDEALAKLGYTPDRRPVAVKFPDGSYRVIGAVVKDPDCPQEDFDFAIQQLSQIYEKP